MVKLNHINQMERDTMLLSILVRLDLVTRFISSIQKSAVLIFSRAVQAERLIWSLWCLYVGTYVWMDVC